MSDLIKHLILDTPKDFFAWWKGQYAKNKESLKHSALVKDLNSPDVVKLQNYLAKTIMRPGEIVFHRSDGLPHSPMILPQLPSLETLQSWANFYVKFKSKYLFVPDYGNGVITSMLCHVLKQEHNITPAVFTFEGHDAVDITYPVKKVTMANWQATRNALRPQVRKKNASKVKAHSSFPGFVFFPWHSHVPDEQRSWLVGEMQLKSLLCFVQDSNCMSGIDFFAFINDSPKYRHLDTVRSIIYSPTITPWDDFSTEGKQIFHGHTVYLFPKHAGLPMKALSDCSVDFDVDIDFGVDVEQQDVFPSNSRVRMQIDRYVKLGILPAWDFASVFPDPLKQGHLFHALNLLLMLLHQDQYCIDKYSLNVQAVLWRYASDKPIEIIDFLAEKLRPIMAELHADSPVDKTAFIRAIENGLKYMISTLNPDFLMLVLEVLWPVRVDDILTKKAQEGHDPVKAWRLEYCVNEPSMASLWFLWHLRKGDLSDNPNIILAFFGDRNYAIERAILKLRLGDEVVQKVIDGQPSSGPAASAVDDCVHATVSSESGQDGLSLGLAKLLSKIRQYSAAESAPAADSMEGDFVVVDGLSMVNGINGTE